MYMMTDEMGKTWTKRKRDFERQERGGSAGSKFHHSLVF